MKTLSLVLNAHSGTTRELGKDRVLDAVRGSADWAEVIVHDCSETFQERVNKACAEPSDYIAVAGGDGTAAAVLNELVRTQCRTPVIPLPLGTANLLPKRLYGDRSIETILREAPDYPVEPLHAGEVDGHLFFCALMAGFPVRFGQAREALRPDGQGRQPARALTYLRKAWRAFGSTRMRLTLDDDEVKKLRRANALMTIPGGAGAMIHGARPGDEVLEHIFTHTENISDALGALTGFLGEMLNMGELHPARSEHSAVLDGPTKIPVMLDGEVLTLKTPIRISLKPNAALFAAPEPDA
ncbi:diacylglycerol kinase family protein [Oceanicaulis sp. MMSF_3324]|uniref:diacylglycerol/lipid kinase family protein n=1 Tax=Oceanicaulis sp. MMSF_3324 TaxID=3046702 RepID=UPI0027402E49|nr:diacylglycerol kinase family protein [Oceanicaulis sp. MMSF_3324]